MARDDEVLMGEALAEAERGLALDTVPIGAVVVHGGEVVARAHWRGFATRRLLDHPELLVLLDAERSGTVSRMNERRETTLYTTLEPCALCMAAAMSFFLGRVVFALDAPSDGAANLPKLWRPANGHPAPAEAPYAIPQIVGGVRSGESLALIERFLETHDGPGTAWARTLVPAG
jgi:tRNA(adenine34) deaminase